MKVPSRDTRTAVEYISRFTGQLTIDVTEAGAGLVAASTMMANVKLNEHADPTFIRVAVIDEAAEIYQTIGCEFCDKGTGIRALTMRVATDRHGNEYYACGGCRNAKGLTEVK